MYTGSKIKSMGRRASEFIPAIANLLTHDGTIID